jgi:hypothetical protein
VVSRVRASSFLLPWAALVAATVVAAGCGTGGSNRGRSGPADDELGGTGAAVLAESADLSGDLDGRPVCRSGFAPTDVAGFTQEWFGAVTSLQRSVDANAVRQLTLDPDGRGFVRRREDLECRARVLGTYRESGDFRIAALASAASALLADAVEAEDRAAEAFRSVDWTAFGTIDAKARRWAEARPSTRDLSERGANLVERIVPLLREDGRATYGAGHLRISRAGREVALRHRGKLTDLTIMVELGIDPDLPMSTAARKVVKWLYHSHDLTFEESSE